MGNKFENLIKLVKQEFSREIESTEISKNELTIVVNQDAIIKFLNFLKSDGKANFSQLIDLCGVDYSTYGATEWQTTGATSSGFSRGVEVYDKVLDRKFKSRFAVVYHLLSIEENLRVRVKTFINDDNGVPITESVINIWSCADWYERETFDLFGIVFNGHPDLRRLLTDYGFVGHPLRKDFPLIGHVEVGFDEEQGKVIYKPVSIEPRVLVPRVIRRDDRYDDLEVKQD